MIEILTLSLTLAQTTQPTATAPTPMSGAEVFFRQILPLLLPIAIIWWFMLRGQRREKKKYQDMINTLKRNDRVQTIGGIIGTVVDVRDNEVTLKVDESSNVKIRFVRGAIKEVLREPPPPEKK
ncbi:preprotein translocase subunit YajC [Phycisphaerae bacterium RAS1]|nr:preprotein translocase subunit YajC [Phycisphaerae bacterium RAS1]